MTTPERLAFRSGPAEPDYIAKMAVCLDCDLPHPLVTHDDRGYPRPTKWRVTPRCKSCGAELVLVECG